jgi:flagellar protein FlaJ
MAEPLLEFARHLEPMFPQMEWNLKRSGFTIDTTQYLSVVLYMTTVVFTFTFLVSVVPFLFTEGIETAYTGGLFTLVISAVALVYFIYIPKVKMGQRSVLIDRDLEYMLKDMQIQLNSGVPLFDTLVNVARGECEGIIQEVEQGKSMSEVLDDVGMWSPSEYFRKTMWQIVNALKTGSDVVKALEAISSDIRMEKENKIKAYGKELNLYGLIYMMLGVILPSMGVTLLVILSSFLGEGMVTETIFWVIMIGLFLFQVVFIVFVKNKRPTI